MKDGEWRCNTRTENLHETPPRLQSGQVGCSVGINGPRERARGWLAGRMGQPRSQDLGCVVQVV